MLNLELASLAIVMMYVGARLRQASDGGQRLAFLVRFVVLAVASFVGDDSVIRAYGFYAYATGWSARLDQVPLVIVLVWPVVIDSAATLARALVSRGQGARDHSVSRGLRVATLGAAIVLADASLIEPIAVRAGLWRWVEPGLFGVPLIGIVGWAFFAWATIMVFECLLGRGLAVIPISELLVRLPGALFFFVLLGITAAGPSVFAAPDARAYAAPDAGLLALVAYAAAFAPPYLTALSVRAAGRRSRTLA